MQTVQGYGLVLSLLIAGFGADWSEAQNYPTKPVRLQTSSGSSEAISRTLAAGLSPLLGQPVVVEIKPAGHILVTGVTKAAPDGYTLLVGGGSTWTSAVLEEVPWDPVRDFTPVSMLVSNPLMLVVTNSLPVTSVKELIAYAKAYPGKLNYSSGPVGSTAHLSGELLKAMAGGVDIVHIAFKSQDRMDVVSGRIHMNFGGIGNWGSLVKAGKARMIASGGARRAAQFPDVPTVAETLPGFVADAPTALLAPAKTPAAVVRKLNQDTVRVLETKEFRERMAEGGTEPDPGTPEDLARYIKEDLARVAKLVKDLGIKVGS